MILNPLTTTNNEYDDTNLRLDSDAPKAARQACVEPVGKAVFLNLPINKIEYLQS